MGRETYETGQTPERLWNDTKSDQYTASPFHDPTNGIGAGGGDAIVAKVAEIPQLVSFGYSIATKEEVRTQLINTVKQVSWPKIQSAATDFFKEKKDKYTNGGNVTMHEASMDAGSVLLELLAGEKILDILKDMLKKLGKEAREAVVKAIKDKLTDPDQIKRLILDIDGSDELLDAVAKNTDLIDSWKIASKSKKRLTERVNPKFLERIQNFRKNFQQPSAARRNLISNDPKYDFSIDVNGKTVKFDKDGFPDFKEYSPGSEYSYKSPNLKGYETGSTDFADASSALKAKFKDRVKNIDGGNFELEVNGEFKKYTWHHHQDGQTLMPVLQEVHMATRPHTGGAAIIKYDIKELFESPY
ncbi:MAG: HNH endonuclease, partial [Flavobacterium sp.]